MTNLKREMANKEFENNNEKRKELLRQKLLFESDRECTQGSSLIFTGEPRMKVHQKRKQIRDKLTANTSRCIEKDRVERFYPSGNQASLEFKPDLKYLAIHKL